MKLTVEQQRAKRMYVKEQRTAKEISGIVKKTEKTIGNWIKKYGWKALRNAEVNSNKAQRERINEILNEYAEQTLFYIRENKEFKEKLNKAVLDNNKDRIKLYSEKINDNNSELARIDDGASKWRKQLTDLEKEGKISLAIYLQVMDDLFDNLRAFDEKVFISTLDFQEKHLTTISLKLA